MKEEKYIRFDWAVKRLLRNKANFGVLEGLLTTLIGEKIQIVEILESESNQADETDKFNRVDIKAKDSKGEIIIVEVQNTRELYYLERILYGTAKAITEHINVGNSYSPVKKVYSISIIYFDLGKGSDYIYRGSSRFHGLNTGDELIVNKKEENVIIRKKAEAIFPEYFLIRVNEFDKVAITPLEEWIAYLKTGRIPAEASAPGLPEAREKLRYYDMTPEERQAYDRHMDNIMIQNDILSASREEGLAEGIAKGEAKGIAKGQRLIAANMKKQGLSIEMIAQYTGMSIEEIGLL